MNIKQTILFILLCSPLISYSQINYTENFDTQGEPNATNNLGWSYTTQIYPAQSTWNDIVPGDGYAYLTVDADTGNDTNPQFAYQTISLSTVPPNHRLEVRMKGAAVQGLVGFIFTYNENQTFNEVDIEIVPDDEGTAPDGHDILAPNGWTDVRINSWRNASPTTFLPTVNTNSAIKDANGNSVSHIDGEFHTYTIDWYENSIDFFIDNVWQNTISQHVAAGESDVILGFRDLAWDGDLNWAGTKTLIID
ncbi:MAG: beta-glucanase (GH16 family), partial [Maribacter sp.]